MTAVQFIIQSSTDQGCPVTEAQRIHFVLVEAPRRHASKNQEWQTATTGRILVQDMLGDVCFKRREEGKPFLMACAQALALGGFELNWVAVKELKLSYYNGYI